MQDLIYSIKINSSRSVWFTDLRRINNHAWVIDTSAPRAEHPDTKAKADRSFFPNSYNQKRVNQQ